MSFGYSYWAHVVMQNQYFTFSYSDWSEVTKPRPFGTNSGIMCQVQSIVRATVVKLKAIKVHEFKGKSLKLWNIKLKK